MAPEAIREVFPRVAEIIADALGREVHEIEARRSLIDDLEAESIDFLDIVYRLERSFGVKIPRGQIEKEVRGDLDDAAFERNGVLTDLAIERLREVLDEAPEGRLTPGFKTADIPRLFTPETFCKIVLRAGRGSA